MIWDESRWLFKVATVFPKIVFDVRHSETGDSLAEATIQINDENSIALWALRSYGKARGK